MQYVGPPANMHLTTARSITATGNQAAKLTAAGNDPQNQIINTAGWLQFQCATAGMVLCMISICLDQAAASGTFAAQIWQNGSKAFQGNSIPLAPAGFPVAQCVNTVWVAANDTLEAGFTVTTLATTSLWNDATLTYASFVPLV